MTNYVLSSILEAMEEYIKRITQKKTRLDSLRPFPLELVKNLDDWYKVELTYTSNAIEGNTLSRQETALVVEKGTTIEGKTLNEQLEAANHGKAVEYIRDLVSRKKKREEVNESDILEIHRSILSGIDDMWAGRYRAVSVRVAGSTVIFPNPAKVPELMKEFSEWLAGENRDHTLKVVADVHLKLVTIHPFVDGNGRTARLLMNLLLLQKGYPAAIIHPEDRREYLNSLEKAQTLDEKEEYYAIILRATERSLDMYLEALSVK